MKHYKIEACCKAFFPMGQKALLKSFAQSHGIKSFATFLYVKLMKMWPKIRQIDGKTTNLLLLKNCVNLTKKLENSANLTKNWKIVQSFFSHGMLQRFFAIVNCIMVCDLTEKSKLQRKFHRYSSFSKPYRN